VFVVVSDRLPLNNRRKAHGLRLKAKRATIVKTLKVRRAPCTVRQLVFFEEVRFTNKL
jgi:hypothetical protein